MNEYLLSVDKYNNPSIKTDEDAIRILLIRLILLNPGTIESHPDMGVGLIRNWRYSEVENLGDLKLDIEKQISTYLPQLQGVSVNIERSQDVSPEIYIYITVNNKLYSFQTKNNTLKNMKG